MAAGTYQFPPLGIRFNSPACFNVELEPTPFGDAAFTRYGRSHIDIMSTLP